MRHRDFIAPFQAWKALDNLLRDKWIWYWISDLSFGYFMSSYSSGFAEDLFLMCKSQGISVPTQMDQLSIVLVFQEQTTKPVFAILFLINSRQCDLPKLCPRDTSWGTVWRISSVCKDLTAGCDAIWSLYLLVLVTQAPDRQYVTWLMPQTV